MEKELQETLNIYEEALRKIANCYLELSHDKVHYQRDLFVRIARKALNESSVSKG
jgi:hypothetical protein